ncbi:MAG: GDSL-type esterase/lipase family protein [Geminicoccaceae bacterium]|nr:GDSL-type esterase/lipase family protein [Geminicoccaceae bacterium]
MALLRTYSGTYGQGLFETAGIARLRFTETAGERVFDSIGGLDGRLEGGFGLGQPGAIGDGAVRFDGTGQALLTGRLDLGVTPTIAVFGDSLTANNGVSDLAQRFAPELDRALAAEGIAADVRNFSVSGETIQDALARVEAVLGADPDLVIVALGTNDAEDQRPLAAVEADLRNLVGQLTDGGAEVLLTASFGYFPGTERGYATAAERDAFEALFAEVAADVDGVTLLRDAQGSDKFLGGARVEDQGVTLIEGGVLADPSLHLDGVHPSAGGVDRIVARIVAPTIDLVAGTGAAEVALERPAGSIEIVVTPERIGGEQVLFARNAPGSRAGDIEARLDDGVVRVSMQDGTGTFRVSSAASGVEAAAGEALHVVFTFGAAGMRLFVNGALVDQNDFTGGLTGNGMPLSIGAASEGGDRLAGTVDEFAVYDRALGRGEVLALFEAGERGVRLTGTRAGDELSGGVDDEWFAGGAGNDLILAGGGDDVLRGGAGADKLRGESGDDVLAGGSGHDRLLGQAGRDQLHGQAGRDRLAGGGDDDRLKGNAGHDRLSGGAGDDVLLGGAGRDLLNGQAGDDRLAGHRGLDTLRGGSGRDTFVLAAQNGAPDRILDFEPGPSGDVLDLGALLDEISADVLRLNESGGDTRLEIAGGGGVTAVADLLGTTGLDLAQLIADGNLVAG